MKLEIGGYKKKGWKSINLINADIIHNLNTFPYPIKDKTCDIIHCFHVLEHLKHPKKVMEEIHRITKRNALIIIKIPHHTMHSILTNPEHLHDFHPKWFMSFDSNTQHSKGVYKNMEHLRKACFMIESIKETRGNICFWRLYDTTIMMRKQ